MSTHRVERALGVSLYGFTRLALLACALILADCATAPTAIRGGTYPLAAVNGLPLPYDEGPEPPRPGDTRDCHSTISGGQLTIDSATGTFTFWYEHGSTCSDRTLGRSDVSGEYRIQGGSLILVATIGEGVTETYRARTRPTGIEVPARYYTLTFRR